MHQFFGCYLMETASSHSLERPPSRTLKQLRREQAEPKMQVLLERREPASRMAEHWKR